jgi:hypothetical protein
MRSREEDSPTMLRGRISGHETRDHVLSGKAGQTLTLQLQTANQHAYFTLSAEDGRRLAGETRHWAGKLPRTGYYRMCVLLKGVEAAPRGTPPPYMSGSRYQ